MDAFSNNTTAPARDKAKEFIINTLEENDGEINSAELKRLSDVEGINEKTLSRAKSELKTDGIIGYRSKGRWETRETTMYLCQT